MIPVSDLSGLLPHRDKMVWIDHVIESSETGGSCLVKVDPAKHYYSPEGVRQSALIEWMAQGYGFICAAHYRQQSETKKLEKAFLVGVDKMSFGERMPRENEEVVIALKVIRVIGPVSYVEGKISNLSDGLVFGELQIKLFSM